MNDRNNQDRNNQTDRPGDRLSLPPERQAQQQGPTRQPQQREESGNQPSDKPNDPKIKVELLRDYVPRSTEPGSNGVYPQTKAGNIIEVPREEAAFLLDNGVAKISGRTL